MHPCCVQILAEMKPKCLCSPQVIVDAFTLSVTLNCNRYSDKPKAHLLTCVSSRFNVYLVPHHLLTHLRKCCCPGHHRPTFCSSALMVSPVEGWGSSRRASPDHRCTGAQRSPLPLRRSIAGNRRAGITVHLAAQLAATCT